MEKSQQNWLIEKAQRNHISEIYAIARSYDCDQLRRSDNMKDGFLVSAYSEDVYKRFLTHADYFYVALEDNTVIGFLLGFSRDLIPEFDWVGTQMKSRDTRPFILIKQAAVLRSHIGKGVAMLFFHYLSEYGKNQPLVSVTVADPPNPRSVRFHEKLGFKKVWEVTPPDGMPRDVWCREPTV